MSHAAHTTATFLRHMLQLLDLGEDILTSRLLPQLHSTDVFRLLLTSHAFRDLLTNNESYHQLYLKLFGLKPVPLDLRNYPWEQLFQLRASKRAKFCTWGSVANFRLGHSSKEFFELLAHNGLNVPRAVDGLNGELLTDISSSGYSFQVLTYGGELYWTGTLFSASLRAPPGPRVADYSPPVSRSQSSGGPRHRYAYNGIFTLPGMFSRYENATAATPTPQAHRPTNPNLRLPPEQQLTSLNSSTDVETAATQPKALPKYLNRCSLPAGSGKLVAVSSGREHVIALSDRGCVYSWDAGNAGDMGVQIEFAGIPSANVSHISAGWNLSACLVGGAGLCVWYSRDSLTQERYEEGRFKVNAHYVKIPRTSGCKIIDFMAGSDYVLFVKGDGKLYRFDIDALACFDGRNNADLVSPPYEVALFNRWLATHNLEIVGDAGAKYSKITGCYNNFAIFTDDGNVLLGNKDSAVRGDDDDGEVGPEIIPELQNRNIKHVVMGDYHYLALTGDGQLLAWGRESKGCGCLGLGDIGVDQVVHTPTPVKPPTGSTQGKWLAVSAAGWHSCGIYIDL